MEVLQTNGVKTAAAAGASSFMVDDDDLLNFSLDDGVDSQSIDGFSKAPFFTSSIPLLGDFSRPPTFPDFVEEELEWLSNKDAFPSVETCFDLLTENPDINVLNHHSPVSVLENSNSSSCSASIGSGIANGSTNMSFYGSLQVPTGFPVRARSKRRLRCRSGLTEFTQQLLWWKQVNCRNDRFERRHVVKGKSNAGRRCLHCHADETPQWRAGPMGPRTLCNACGVRYVVNASKSRSNVGRRCLHCQADETPQWRAGPMGPKTLCNACGVRYKSGRLVPEYRPANSPTFSAAKHSNSHRKIVEMRKQKQAPMGGGFTGVVSGGFMGSESRTDSGEQGFGIGIGI